MAYDAADDNNYSPLGFFEIPADFSNDARMMDCPEFSPNVSYI